MAYYTPGQNPAMQPNVQQGMQQGAPQLDQMSNQAMSPNLADQGLPQSAMTNGVAPTQQQNATKYEPKNQEEFIVKSLLEYLKTLQDTKKAQVKSSTGEQPQIPVPALPQGMQAPMM